MVDLPPEADEASVERVMAMLRSGSAVFQRIEEHSPDPGSRNGGG